MSQLLSVSVSQSLCVSVNSELENFDMTKASAYGVKTQKDISCPTVVI